MKCGDCVWVCRMCGRVFCVLFALHFGGYASVGI